MTWTWDTFPAYRLQEDKVRRWLMEKFGEFDFFLHVRQDVVKLVS